MPSVCISGFIYEFALADDISIAAFDVKSEKIKTIALWNAIELVYCYELLEVKGQLGTYLTKVLQLLIRGSYSYVESVVPFCNILEGILSITECQGLRKSMIQTLKRFTKKPWEFTGPQTSPEYLDSVPKATEYRIFCPATTQSQAIIPTSDSETVFDINYYSRDQRRNRPPIKRTFLTKADVEKMRMEYKFDVNDFPKPYLTAKVEEDENAIGGGYQK
uniref:Uncharacterized protein n=1 Tax=Solanum tuberosum TaxID=4113 RepID=M1DAL2_SOLTU